jgi:hypothetical protein
LPTLPLPGGVDRGADMVEVFAGVVIVGLIAEEAIHVLSDDHIE